MDVPEAAVARLETLLRPRRQSRSRGQPPTMVQPRPVPTVAHQRSPAVVVRHGAPATLPPKGSPAALSSIEADRPGAAADVAAAAAPTKLRVAGISRTRGQLLLTSGDGDRFVLTVDRHLIELVDRAVAGATGRPRG